MKKSHIFLKLSSLFNNLGPLGCATYLLARGQQVALPTAGRVTTLFSKDLTAPVFCRLNTSDMSVFWAVFCKNSYGPLRHINPTTIIDLGANIGLSSAFLLSQFTNARLAAVEPDINNIPLLKRNLQNYGSRATVIHAGAWPSCTGLSVRRSDLGHWATRVQPSNKGETPDILGIDVTSVMQRVGFERVGLLKVDIEGSEEEVFSSCEAWIELVDNIVIELHGEKCRNTFFQAIQGRYEHWHKQGELTFATMKV